MPIYIQSPEWHKSSDDMKYCKDAEEQELLYTAIEL